jgi:hypothetical protein
MRLGQRVVRRQTAISAGLAFQAWLTGTLLATAASPGSAQVLTGSMANTGFLLSSLIVKQADEELFKKARPAVEKGSGAAPRWDAGAVPADRPARSTTFAKTASGSTAPAKLAENYPAERRADAQRLFTELLRSYGDIERRFGVPRNDVAGAVAAFLAGGWMAYNNADFPDENFKPLVAQMRGVLAGNAEFAAASDAEKQELYERMAILGTFMATTQMALKERPNAQVAANVKAAAKAYLEQFLKADAQQVQITGRGLTVAN